MTKRTTTAEDLSSLWICEQFSPLRRGVFILEIYRTKPAFSILDRDYVRWGNESRRLRRLVQADLHPELWVVQRRERGAWTIAGWSPKKAIAKRLLSFALAGVDAECRLVGYSAK